MMFVLSGGYHGRVGDDGWKDGSGVFVFGTFFKVDVCEINEGE